MFRSGKSREKTSSDWPVLTLMHFEWQFGQKLTWFSILYLSRSISNGAELALADLGMLDAATRSLVHVSRGSSPLSVSVWSITIYVLSVLHSAYVNVGRTGLGGTWLKYLQEDEFCSQAVATEQWAWSAWIVNTVRLKRLAKWTILLRAYYLGNLQSRPLTQAYGMS